MADPSDPNTLPKPELTGALHPTAAAPSTGPSGTLAQVSPSQAALASAPSHLEVPGYEVLGELGRGGMGAVFKGRDIELGRDLAIKVLLETRHSNEETLQRFREEAQIGGQLQHPGVVPVYEMGRLADDRPYFTMKLVEGRTLAALLKDRKNPADDLPRFLKIFEQICQTLAYAHARGVIHRDLKPLNVMVGAFGEVQVMDWGLAKVVKGGGVHTTRSEAPDSGTTAGSIFGTPAYMAPEQACGDVEGLDQRCDVFGLGAMLCEVLTGEPPYRSQERGSLLRQAARADLTDAFNRLESCEADAELVGLAKSCLAAEPADRPRDGGAAAEAMAGYLAGVQERLHKAELERAAAEARVEAAQAKARAERRARRLTVGLAVMVLLAAASAGAGALWYQHDQNLRAMEQARKASVTERDVAAALEEAATLGAQAKTFTDDPTRWEAATVEALSAVKRAEGVLNSGVGTDELRGRVDALRQELESDDKDRRMVARLEEARLQLASNGVDNAGATALYATAFEQDMGLAALGPDEAGQQINRRAIRDELLAALDLWALISPNKAEVQRLLDVARAVDPDPKSFRNRWQALAANKDKDGLRLLASSPEAQSLPLTRQATLRRQFFAASTSAEALGVLKAANDQRPDDFVINFELGNFFAMAPGSEAKYEAIRYFTGAVVLRPHSAAAHYNLGAAFLAIGRMDEAVAEYRKAIKLKPDLEQAYAGLGKAFLDKGRPDEAIAEYRKAVEVKPGWVSVHIGAALAAQGKTGEAEAEYRKAIALKPDYFEAHFGLGLVLRTQGKTPEAETEFVKASALEPSNAIGHLGRGLALSDRAKWAEVEAQYRQAIGLNLYYFEAHFNLGNALKMQGKQAEAEIEYRKAVALRPDDAKANLNLAFALESQGRFPEFLVVIRRCLDYESKKPGGNQAAAWVGEAEKLCRLDAALPAILKGEATPPDAAGWRRLALFCHQYKKLYATSVRFHVEAFKVDAALAENLSTNNRYNAACAAALAGCGKGEDTKTLDDKECDRLRKEALDWLRADLTLWAKKIADDPKGRGAAHKALQQWQKDADLACVRDMGALSKLPPDEQDAWRKLWSDVDELLKKVETALPPK